MPFEKGKSGNPGGRPKEAVEVKALARSHCVAAIEKLAALMNCGNQRVEVAAAQALLDRGYGKPHQTLEVDSRPRHVTEMTDAELEEAIRQSRAIREGSEPLRTMRNKPPRTAHALLNP